MGIRKKTCLSIVAAVAIAIGAFYQLADRTIHNRFTTLEKKQALNRLNYTLRLLKNGRDNLHLFVRDWGTWNDSYDFMESQDPAFVASNLMEETFSTTGLAYIGFHPLQGKAIWEGAYNHTAKRMESPPKDLARTIERLMVSLRVRGAESRVLPGFILSREALQFMAASPVLKSDGSGPCRGWVIMVQRLEKGFFSNLFPQTDVTLAPRHALDEADTPRLQFSDNWSRYICTGPLDDILGHATIEITLTGPADIILAGRRLLALTGGGICVTGLALALITCLLIQRPLLNRVLFLRQQLASVAIPGTPIASLPPHGDDELSELTEGINGVFKRISEEECLNRNILTSLNIGILLIDGQSETVQDTNACMEKMTGKTREELVGQPAKGLFHPLEASEQPPHAPHREKGVLQGNPSRQVVRGKTETRYHGRPIRIETFTDIQALAAEVADARRSESHYRDLFKNSATASVLFCEDGTVSRFNHEFQRYAGAKEPRELLGRHWTDFVSPKDKKKLQAYLEEKKDTVISFDDNVEVTFHDLLGGRHTAKVHITRLPETKERIVSMLDMTRQKKAEEMLRHQAFYDSLTGLANRRLFLETLAHAMDVAKRRQRTLTLLLIDLDGFKSVNDTLGHQSGDLLLTMVANRLISTLRQSDTVSRLGGDEFTILVEECYSAQELVLLLHRLRKAFTPPFEIGTTRLNITLSIGVARFPDDATDSETLIRNADLAMYRAKKTGDAYKFYTHRLDKEARARFEMEQELRRAIDGHQFSLYLQPRIGLDGNRLLGVEGLIRWCHPVKGLCLPADFIPCAEMNGLIVPMDLWALETGCRLITRWNRDRTEPLLISLNISAWHFRETNLPEQVAGILKETGCDPRWLELEVTETALMANLTAASPHLEKLKSMGVSIALDDFGTGCSSLNYLRQIPVDTLKIDRSFIAPLDHEDTKSLFLVKSIVELGATFGIRVVAEGVENPKQLRLLQAMGCPAAQGFLWSPPRAPEDFPHHLTVYHPEKK